MDLDFINSCTAFNKKERVMDIDNLQGICIYLVESMKYPYLGIDYKIVTDFVSKNVGLSSRSIFLNVLKGGIDYLLQKADENETEIDKKSGINISHDVISKIAKSTTGNRKSDTTEMKFTNRRSSSVDGIYRVDFIEEELD